MCLSSSKTEPLGAGSGPANSSLFFPLAVGFRVSAAAASDEPLCPGYDGSIYLGRAGCGIGPRRTALSCGPAGRRRPACSSLPRLFPKVCARTSGRPRFALCSTPTSPAIAGRSSRWYYTPMMLPFSRHIAPACTSTTAWTSSPISASRPPELLELEQRADRQRRPRLHRRLQPLRGQAGPPRQRPSASRRRSTAPISPRRAPARRARRPGGLPHPRLGFFGVIDERFDIELLDRSPTMRPDWPFVMVGPVVKIDPRRAAAARQHPLSRRQDLRRAAGLSRAAGTSR